MKQEKPEPTRVHTTGYVAAACQVSVVAVKKWIVQGKLKAIRTPGGHYRIAADELERFRAEYHFPGEAAAPGRVLVVDDEPEIAAFIRDGIGQSARWEIEVASEGYDGLLKVGTFRPDVLVLDLKMPNMDGFEVCRRVKGNPLTRSVSILAITGDPALSVADRALRSGADAFLAKPFRIADLRQHLERLTVKARAS
ncbi:MAG TPA: response regulator [Candidatus Limnocylindria bacterium]|nr:response regulator [Candidatus Limnocylindria bacterium]